MIEVVCNDRLGKKIRVKAKYCPFPPPCDLSLCPDEWRTAACVPLIFPNEDRPWSCNRKGGSMEPELQLLAFTQVAHISFYNSYPPVSAWTCCIHPLLV